MHWAFNIKRFNSLLLFVAVSVCVSACVTEDGKVELSYIQPVSETEPVPSVEDAADDSAIWIHPDQPGQALIVATDKGSGLLLYNLEGKQLQHLPLGKMNNVDLRQRPWQQSRTTLIAATRRDQAQLVLLSLDADRMSMQVVAEHPLMMADPYGVCMFQDYQGKPYVIVNSKGGQFLQFSVTPEYQISEVRRWRTHGQPEGCVVDDKTAQLYLGEEEKGIWSMSARPQDEVSMTLVDDVENGYLHADVEGLALHHGAETLLIASSQGDNAFVVYNAVNGEYLTTFGIESNGTVDGVSETDGISVTALPLSGFEHGLLVVQDGYNEHPVENQNFKLISWGDIAPLLAD